MSKRILFILITISFFVSSCTSKKTTVYLNNRPETYDTIQYNKKNISNTLQPGDVVYVRILSVNKEINSLFNLEGSSNSGGNITSETSISLKGFTINPNGYISLPILDTILIKDLTEFQAQQKIQEKVDEYIVGATVIVKLLNSKISVLGEVNRPGSFIVQRNELTIFEAIAMAGDVNAFGDKRNIMVIRTSTNKNQTYKIDLTDEAVMSSDKIYLLPNDIIIVQPRNLKAFRANQNTIMFVLTAITTYLGIMATFK